MIKQNRWKTRTALAILVAFTVSSAITPARAEEVSAQTHLDALKQAIQSTQEVLRTSTKFSFNEESLAVDDNLTARKASTRLIVTPTVSEYFQSNFQSVDNQATWQTDFPLGMNHVYVTSDKAYSIITKDHFWGAGYGDFSIQEIQKASPFPQTWVIGDTSGPNALRNAINPIDNSGNYIEGIGAGASYLEGISGTPPISSTILENGDIEYLLEIDLRLTYTYTVSGTSGLVTKMLLESVYEGTNLSATYSVAVGDQVEEPNFDPRSLDAIEQTAIVDIARGLTAQAMLTGPANLLVKITNNAAKKLRQKVNVTLLRQTAKRLFIQSKITAVSSGIRLTGSYQNKTGYMCVYVKSAKLYVKGCK